MKDEQVKLGTPRKISQLADYQANSIVSQSIKKSERGNITFFAFAQGEQLSTHSAPFDAFLQVVEGDAKVTIGEEAYSVSSGMAVMLPANVPHGVQAPENMKMLLVMIKE